MQAYSAAFAKVYNMQWAGFSKAIGPKIEQLLASTPETATLPKTMLDICCGTGHLANHFLGKGYTVRGIDLSPHMIDHAIANNSAHVDSGIATFTVGDASAFNIKDSVSLATCLFDSMNHLPSIQAVSSCIKRAYDSISTNGLFIFDINSQLGLRKWNMVSVQEDDQLFMLTRGIYDPDCMDRAYTEITGFVRDQADKYDRFSLTAFNLAVSVDEVLAAVAAAGFRRSYCARMDDLSNAVTDPEALQRVFFICRR